MTTEATDIVSIDRLLRELRASKTIDNILMAEDLIKSSVQYVSQYSYPLIDETRWHRFNAPNSNFKGTWTIYLPGLVDIESFGYWSADDWLTEEPPHKVTEIPVSKIHQTGRVTLYPPSDGWPVGAEYMGLEATIGWREDSFHGNLISQAVILWAREIYDDTPSIAPTHPIWTLLKSVRPGIPRSEVPLNK